MRRAALWVAVAVVALAAGLRLHGLSTWSLDGDEVYTFYDVRSVLDGETWPEGVRSHPLGYLAIAGCVSLLGEGEGPLRLCAAVCGIAAVAALLFVRRDAVPRAAALGAGVLAALSPWLLYHSQEARFYSPLVLCATLATLWALPGPGRNIWAATLAAAAAVLCHPSALTLLPCLLLPPIAARLSRVQLLLVVGAALVAVAAWLAWGDDAAARAVRAALVRQTLAHYDAVHFVAGVGYNVGAGVGLLAAVGSVIALRRRAVEDWQLLLAAWAPPALLLLAAVLGVSVQQRYVLAAAPALLLLAGRALQPLADRPSLAVAVLGLALLPSLPQLVDTVRTGDRSDMRGAAAWLVTHARPGDNIAADEHATLDLYLRQTPGFADRASDEVPLKPAKKMWNLLRNERDCWIVVKSSRLEAAYGKEFRTWLEQGFVERARIGRPAPPLVQHDNLLLIYQRRARVASRPEPGSPAGPRKPAAHPPDGPRHAPVAPSQEPPPGQDPPPGPPR